MVNGVLKQIDWVKRNSGKNSGISGNWPKNPEIPELSKWFGIAITTLEITGIKVMGL